MKNLKLTYFDFPGGRGEPARLALFLGGIDFEDQRIPSDQWPALKTQMPFHALPVLEVDGKTISQCNTINRYVGRLTDLYPTDPWQAALCDEVMDAIEDIGQQIFSTLFMTDEDEKKRLREALENGPIPVYLNRLQAYLSEHGGEYFADNRLTVADLKVYIWIRHLRSGNLDYISPTLVEQCAPLLVKHFERVNSHARIIAYYQRP